MLKFLCVQAQSLSLYYSMNCAQVLSFNTFESNNVHVVVERASAVVVDDLLARALPLPHGLEAAVPVEELEDGHQLLELEHRLPPVGA